ncbi:hypothetical protein [Bacillus velezensis]|uniref:hypothetical protein n=1 Tax=Bacillus TaxID=1386 RepID=UPI002240337C|nr:hypothetical protein [Bacillus velezensis]
MNRKRDLEAFLKELYRIEQTYGFKVETENPLDSLVYIDNTDEKLYSYSSGKISEW